MAAAITTSSSMSSRDASSQARGRAHTNASGRATSPRPRTPVATIPKLTTVNDAPAAPSIERKVSASGAYGHHRQASIVHGSIQHSRNTSFVNTPSTSPLTPRVVAEVPAQRGADGKEMLQDALGNLPTLNGTSGVSSVGLKGHSPSTSVGEQSVAASSGGRRPQRMHSGGGSRREHNRSQSRAHHNQQESRTVGEYALHHLFNSFIALAEQKIAECLNNTRAVELRVESICGPGIDPGFDQLISALGHVARQKPKPLIDTLMLWRKGKSEAANAARAALSQSRSLGSAQNGVGRHTAEGNLSLQQAVVAAERKSTVSIYLLCRVLMEIFAQSSLSDVTPDMADRLEDIIYKQLSAADPEYLEESPLRQSNWVIFGQLLGAMSDMDFDNVSRRFIEDLDKMQLHLGVRRETEGRAVLVIRGMRWLKVKYSSDAAWDSFCNFMQSLARVSANASGQAVKYEFNILFEELLLPLAADATSQLNVPKWRATIEVIKSRLFQMLAKPKHWQNVFPTLAVALCASPQESFAAQWLSLVMPLQSRLKERSTRPAALRAICRLVWTYLYRVSDSVTATVKHLTDIIKLVFIPGKKSYVTTEPAIAEPLVHLIRIIGFKFQDLCFRTIIFPLMNSELFTSGREIRIVDLEPEKIVVGIRGFLATMTDLEKGEPSPFPVNFEGNQGTEPFQVLPNPASPRPMIESLTKTSVLKEERLSRPVMTSSFSDVTRDAYTKFCKILGEITLFCDNAFGGQAVLDEKFSQTPKTPMAEAFSFSRRDDHQSAAESRQGFYDLLHVAVQALPRCLSPHISFKSLINLLCTGTAHVQSNIAASSGKSLKAIARQSHAQQVTVGFARFIFSFDDRYATMSDGGMLGPEHIESTLSLYVELLQIWIEEIRQKTKRVAEPSDDSFKVLRGAQLDLSTLLPHVDEIESHGLFFLCSPSRRVRAFAITVLRLVIEFDAALGKETTRIIKILEGSPQMVVNVDDEKLTVAERSRLQRGLRKSSLQSTLVELCASDAAYDSTLWFKMFPNLIRITFELCPFATTLTREMICARISQMQKTVNSQAEGYRHAPYPSMDSVVAKGGIRLTTTAPAIVIEQWKIYLIFACTTLTNSGSQQHVTNQAGQHLRKSSKSSQQGDRIQSAGELFGRVIPFLAVPNSAVRDAVVAGLGSINVNLYRTLLESLHPAVTNCNEEAKIRMANHQRSTSSPRPQSRRTEYLRTEIAHVYKLTSHFLKEPEVFNDEWILHNLVNYTKELRLFLNDAEIQSEWEYTKLRTHYCGLIEALYEGITRSKDPIRWMSFQSRKAAFALMEDWCGYSPNQTQIRQREDSMRKSMLDREQDLNRGSVTAAMEIERRDLRTAALSAMATLCGGPISITTDSKAHLQFDVLRMLSWIDTIFDTPSDKNHNIGRRALKNLIQHNKEHDYFLRRSIDMCYMAKSPKALESYFEVVNDVLTGADNFGQPFWKVLCACLFTLGNDSNHLRMKTAKLLRLLEERQLQGSSRLGELDISISDKTIAVYKRAQFEMSQRLAQDHLELAFHVFSEFSRIFKDLQPDPQRQMVASMLPWVQKIELQIDPNGGPTATSYMLLVNLFEITVRCGNQLHNEIQALWQALATGPHGGNVQLVLDFMITLCLDKKEQDFVNYAKQIVVYLSGTPAGSKVVEFLLMQITPKAMVQEKEKRQSFAVPPEATALPYLADLAAILPVGTKQQGFSLGQLCLILLVDLMVAPVQLSKDSVPMLLQVILTLWDHYIPVVQDHAREMLVHLMHELVNSKIDDQATDPTKREIEDFIESIRRSESKVVWTYEDYNGKKEEDSELRVPAGMIYVASQVVKIFAIVFPGIREELGKVALKWASNCPVHHLACRSFQLFRSVLSSLDQPMLADMLARLSNTVADEGTEVQTFSMEILTTLKTIIDALAPADLIQYPQLFWTTCASLNTIHEREFMESLAMLERLMEKLDLGDTMTVQRLSASYPPKWEGGFEGLQSLIYKGVRSSVCLERSLRLLEQLTVLPANQLVGDDSRLLFTVMANFPRYLRWFEQKDVSDPAVLASARTLAGVADRQGLSAISSTLQNFAEARYRTDRDFISSALPAIRSAFFPDLEFKCLVFLMSLLTNKLPWFKIKTMQLLCTLIPDIDMRKPEITSKGPDLITPLLRLLQTEFCPQALAVLDNVMSMTATPMDNKHLRMSMAGANTSRAFRKEYERVQSLYGIPEESGWAIPMPAVHSSTTRANVHAVFYTCAIPDTTVEAEEATPNIELVAEDSYFPEYRTATMMSDDTRGEGHMGDLVMKLESLDDFFDDDDTPAPETSPSSDPSMHGRQLSGAASVDNRENVYDNFTYPILHKSLTRTASVSSFQNGFSDMKIPLPPQAAVMTPGAFAADVSMPPHSSHHPVRPTLHSRSVTSPAVNQTSPPDPAFSFSIDEAAVSDEPGMTSDDEAVMSSSGRPSTSDHRPELTSSSSEKLSFLDNVTRQGQGIRFGLRSGIRRLTGGASDRDSSRAREALRKELLKSPQVPKVPEMYLQNPRSSEI